MQHTVFPHPTKFRGSEDKIVQGHRPWKLLWLEDGWSLPLPQKGQKTRASRWKHQKTGSKLGKKSRPRKKPGHRWARPPPPGQSSPSTGRRAACPAGLNHPLLYSHPFRLLGANSLPLLALSLNSFCPQKFFSFDPLLLLALPHPLQHQDRPIHVCEVVKVFYIDMATAASNHGVEVFSWRS